ncbi:MAG: hypothetical protein FWB93_04020, partial [Oscillospiraceae bacterium]|nr:hypothetical protein [Oscillospiraceae bacterium]
FGAVILCRGNSLATKENNCPECARLNEGGCWRMNGEPPQTYQGLLCANLTGGLPFSANGFWLSANTHFFRVQSAMQFPNAFVRKSF